MTIDELHKAWDRYEEMKRGIEDGDRMDYEWLMGSLAMIYEVFCDYEKLLIYGE